LQGSAATDLRETAVLPQFVSESNSEKYESWSKFTEVIANVKAVCFFETSCTKQYVMSQAPLVTASGDYRTRNVYFSSCNAERIERRAGGRRKNARVSQCAEWSSVNDGR